MPNRCSPDAPMSAYELRALRYLWRGRPELVEEAHRELLIRLGLATVDIGGALQITEDGTHRFMVERHRSDFALVGASSPAALAAASPGGGQVA